MSVRLDLVEVGTRVAYEDMANPLREGVVTEILEHGNQTTPSGLPVPGCTQYRVRWDDESGETVSDLRQHGWDLLADMPGSPFDGAPIIYAYSTADAIEDGTLVPTADLVPDEPSFAVEAGFNVSVVLTAAVADLVRPTVREAAEAQSIEGRLWDVLNMARAYRPRNGGVAEWRFPCIFKLMGPERAAYAPRACRKTMHFRCVVDAPGGYATIMLANES